MPNEDIIGARGEAGDNHRFAATAAINGDVTVGDSTGASAYLQEGSVEVVGVENDESRLVLLNGTDRLSAIVDQSDFNLVATKVVDERFHPTRMVAD
ncbi:hypothetical protein [Mycolicibacterium vinylchloridicum]|uniref:hypothetical protein n=1 Tax=Mycolicibacterium vinylchloridicum TaxID=2736928 RepID=UPI001F20846E|nr:hypothetical protein [Mycolicibacterium vinylchloridicum]